MREEKFQVLQLTAQSITALSTLGLAISIFVSVYSINQSSEWNRQSHEWNRRSHTIEIIGGFEGHVEKYRAMLTENFPALYIKDKRGRLEPEIARKLWRIETQQDSKYEFMKDKKKIETVRNQLIGLLNYMEYLSMAYHENIVDPDAFEKSLADPIILYHDYLEEFIKASNEGLDYQNWKPVSDFVANIKKNRAKDIPDQKPPTG